MLEATPGMRIRLSDQEATERLGQRLAAQARPGDVVLLRGPIGAGKSTLARAFLRAASSDPGLDVPSPTFTLVQSYDLPPFRVHHLDLWRLRGPADLIELGWETWQQDVSLVEWPERLGAAIVTQALDVDLRVVSETVREAVLRGWAERLGTATA